MEAILLALALLAPVPQQYNVPFAPRAAGGSSEFLAPNAVSSGGAGNFRLGNGSTCGGTVCSSANCETQIDEDPDTPDNNVNTTNINGASNIQQFPTPSSNPLTTTDAQTIRAVVSRCDSSCTEAAGGTNPSYTIALRCGTVTKATLGSSVTVTGLDQDDSYSFTYTPDGDCDAAGANVNFEITSTASANRHVCIEAVEWEAAQ